VSALQETEAGQRLFEELLWVHDRIRRDLETVQALAVSVPAGTPVADVREQLDQLQTAGPLWQLRFGCLRYCRFVHSHHNLEDAALLPALQEVDPGLAPVVERLRADHRRVSDLLGVVEEHAGRLGDPADEQGAREQLGRALHVLADHLLRHLDFEEREAGPAIRRMESWPTP
jgi:hypothetical protein